MIKVILDTDIGSDIDDAVCLAYLLAQSDCDLLGVTTVSGQPVERAKMVSAICRVAGRDIPIYPGTADPFLVAPKQPVAQQAAKLDRWPHATEFPSHEAIEFLRRTIRQNPREVTLLTIGPLTNIALLFAIDPEIPGLLKELVMMCGVFSDHHTRGNTRREWNAMLDPHATAMVYRAQPPVHRSLGLDVTTQVVMDREAVRARFDTPLLRPVLDFAEVWFEQRDHITFHDPLAAVSIFDPQVVGYQQGTVSVDVSDTDMAGRTLWEQGDGYHEVALTVDADRFFTSYFGVFA